MPRNIIVFLSDDHAQWAAHCYGNSEIKTPTLDYLADTGVAFENAYTPTPVCSPARASFFTGRTPSQHGMHDYLAEADPEVRAVDWLGSEVLLSQILQEAGYFTGLSGKWHLGTDEKPAPGFDFWYCRSAPVSEASGYHAPWEAPPAVEEAYDRHAITDRAIEFLRNRDRERPFFLVIGHIATHSPWTGVPERLVDQYRSGAFRDIPADATYPFGGPRSESLYSSREDPREALAQYYAAVTDIDEQVGRVIDELDSLRVRESTTVFYTSDHGLNAGHHGIWGKGNATLPYNVLDESIRIPLIVNSPGAVLGRQRRIENVSHLDTFQTILELAGCRTPDAAHASPYPGRSYARALIGQPLAEPREHVFAEYGNLRMVRSADLKLVRRYPDGPHELFDLRADPRETRNVIHDPAYAAKLSRLDGILEDYFAQHAESAHNGLAVLDQPRHNGDEAWRDGSGPAIAASHGWLEDLERAAQLRRRERTQFTAPSGTGNPTDTLQTGS
ncbi:sulfatase family protein [Arthrobacter sp. B2a2-09]|uniref:sulfatase family protein n=1 Tax=Arthrobacter sp. B2a2-09 TaxID=2952822 RepID=UPI0022CD938A|nr:sulfatase-like hydrolase/transferase [Arthrobacter sp. B2a2-09]MCZ9884930.1 sulfatase-like hydrolase/transferase [Arthrobacter sp. B2a2-09]